MIAWLTGVIGICTAVAIVLLMRHDRLHARHGMGWMVVALAFAVLGLYPGLLDAIAGSLGVAYPPALALTLGITLLVLKILVMDIERAHLEIRYQRLVQRVAMLETDLGQQPKPGDSQTEHS